MSAVELLTEEGDTLADHARTTAAWSVLASVARAEYDRRRTGPLADRLRQAAELTGSSGMTSRVDGVGKVILTDPQPSVRVTDAEAFAGWSVSHRFLSLVRCRDVVRVLDHTKAAAALDEGNWGILRDNLEADTEWFVAEDAVDRLVNDGAIKVTDDGVYSTEDGEPVPGLSVSTAQQQVRLTVDKPERAKVTSALRAALGVGGDA